MTSSQSRIWTELDFEREGKQIGALMVDHSVTRSAYGMVPVPAAVIRNGEGPTVLMLAGNHGDEFESQIVLSELIREFDPHDLKGRLIVLPAANTPAAKAGARVSPLDGGNLNRSFPGDPTGGPTQQIAYYTTERMKSFIRSVASAPYGSQQNGRRALWRESQGRGCARPAPEGH